MPANSLDLVTKTIEEKTVIGLNSRSDEKERRTAFLLLPFWAILGPPIAMFSFMHNPINSMFVAIFCASFVYLLRYHASNKISFSRDKIYLPGIKHRVIDGNSIEKITIEGQRDYLCLYAGGAGTKPFLVPTEGLTMESAKKLWHCLAKVCPKAEVDFNVRQMLSAWGQADATLLPPATGNREISILVDLRKVKGRASWLDHCINLGDTFIRSWIIGWIAIGIFLGVSILTVGQFLSVFSTLLWSISNNPIVAFLLLLFFPFFVSVGSNAPVMKSLLLVFHSIGLLCLPILIAYIFHYFIHRATAVDEIFIDYLGVTSRIRTKAGTLTYSFIGWKALESINLTRNKYERDRSLVFHSRQSGKADISIPLSTVNDPKTLETLQEAIQVWARDADISPEVLSAIKPHKDSSFTELWISSINTAPAIEDLTPLTEGSELRTRPYVIHGLLSAGGQGVTYLVKEKTSQELFVLKEVILPAHSGHRLKERVLSNLAKEADLLHNLNSQNIARLVDHFVEGARAYLLLEYISGVTLQEKVKKQGPMETEKALRLALTMCEMLTYLHDQNPPVLHRDFTPHNLILDLDDNLKLIDFGVALEHSDLSTLEKASMVGKQGYMPVEQIRGKSTKQSDIYALGCSLYYLLTAHEPEGLQTLHPKSLCQDLPQQIDDLVSKCTAQRQEDRFSSARKLSEQIEQVLKTLQEDDTCPP